jgi:WD40 repeat protein
MMKYFLLFLLAFALASCKGEFKISPTATFNVVNMNSETPTSLPSTLPSTQQVVPTPTQTPLPSPVEKDTLTQYVISEDAGQRLGRSRINKMSVDPTGKIIVIATYAGVWAYDLSDGRVLMFYDGEPVIRIPHSEVADIQWSPDGNYVAVSKKASGVWIWNANTWELASEFQEDAGPYIHRFPGFAWSPNSSQMAFGLLNGDIAIWDKTSNQWNIKKNNTNLSYIFGILWTKDGKLMQVFGWEMFDAETGEFVKEVPHGIDGPGRIFWSPNESHLFWLFDMGSGVTDVANKKTVFFCCQQFSWSRSGQYYATYFYQTNSIYVLDTTTNEVILEKKLDDLVYAVAWTPNDELLAATYQEEGKLVLKNIHTSKIILNLNEHDIFRLVDGKQGPKIISISKKVLREWDIQKKEVIQTIEFPQGKLNNSNFLYQKQSLISLIDEKGVLHIWNLADLTNEILLPGGFKGDSARVLLIEDKNYVLLSENYDSSCGPLQVWNFKTKEKISEINFDCGFNARISYDAKTLIISGDYGTTSHYSLESFEIKRSREIDQKPYYFHSLEQNILITYNPIVFWNIQTEEKLPILKVNMPDLEDVILSRDGKNLITVDRENKLLAWDTIMGLPNQEFRTDARVMSMALSPTNNLLVIGTEAGDIIFWDIQSGEYEVFKNAHASGYWGVWKLIWNQDGTVLYSSSADGVIKVWNVNKEK